MKYLAAILGGLIVASSIFVPASFAGEDMYVLMPKVGKLYYHQGIPTPNGSRTGELLTLLFRQVENIPKPDTINIYILPYKEFEEELKDRTGIDTRGARAIGHGFLTEESIEPDKRVLDIYLWQMNDRILIHETFHYILSHIGAMNLLNSNITAEYGTKVFITSKQYKEWLRDYGN